MPARERPADRPDRSEILEAGIVAGLLGGVLMAAVAMIQSAAVDLGFWLPLKLIAGLYFGVEALIGDGGVIVFGAITHLVTASLWGVVFAGLAGGRLHPGLAIIAGLGFGVAVWFIMTYAVLPFANPTMLDRVNLSMGWFFVYHLIFGATLALSPQMARGFHRRHLTGRAPAPA